MRGDVPRRFLGARVRQKEGVTVELDDSLYLFPITGTAPLCPLLHLKKDVCS